MPQWRRELKRALQRAKAAAGARARRWRRLVLAGRTRRSARDAAPDDACACWRRSIRWCGIAGASSCFWGWAYRFEAYTPATQRTRGYYALPLLWRDRVIGWGNLSVKDGELQAEILAMSEGAARDRAFARALEAELERMRSFLGL